MKDANNNIKIMPETLASQVAAGEVVVRPASVIKELLENSIDAQAKNIFIKVIYGGVSLIKIEDDGIGMKKNDALLCIERHATSKIKNVNDLSNIQTFGFRGEALPSIASVSNFKLTSRHKSQSVATKLIVNGGKLIEVTESGHPIGTTIEIKNLFLNVPARRKFLKTISTEFKHIEQVIKIIAISHPQIAFTLMHGERVVFKLPNTNSHLERIRNLIGSDVCMNLLKISHIDNDKNEISINGFVSKFENYWHNTSLQYFYVNNRNVNSLVFRKALNSAYDGFISSDKYVIAFLFINMSPNKYDINVHPAKLDIRFENTKLVESKISSIIYSNLIKEIKKKKTYDLNKEKIIKNNNNVSIINNKPNNKLDELNKIKIESENLNDSNNQVPKIKNIEKNNNSLQENLKSKSEYIPIVNKTTYQQEVLNNKNISSEIVEQKNNSDTEINKESEIETNKINFKILAILSNKYILLENKEGLTLVDIKNAFERIYYEKLLKKAENFKKNKSLSQSLLIPEIIELSPQEFDLIINLINELKMFGFNVEPFGQNSLKIDKIPAFLQSNEEDPKTFLLNLIENIQKSQLFNKNTRLKLTDNLKKIEKLASIISKELAKNQIVIKLENCDEIVFELLKCDMPYCNSKGKATMIMYSMSELSKKFN